MKEPLVPIFIGGYMHSGTSMLINILKKHTMIQAIKPELRLFESHPSYHHPHQGKKKLFDAIVKRLNLQEEQKAFIESAREDLMKNHTTYGELTVGIVESLARSNGKSFWAEKTPSNIFFIDQILKMFPSARIILIYRDGRNIMASKKIRTQGLSTGRYSSEGLNQKKLEKDWNILADSFSWQGSIKRQLEAVEKYPDQILTIQYETFVDYPSTEWKRICDFLKIPFQENCLDIKFRNAAIKSATPSVGIVASGTTWENILTPREIALANRLNRTYLKRLGYSVDIGTTGVFKLTMYFFQEIPGVFRRLRKRYKMFSPAYFYIYCRSMLRRI